MISLCEYYGDLDFSVRHLYIPRLLRSLFLWQSCISMIGIQRSLCELFCSHLLDFLSEASFLGRALFFWLSGPHLAFWPSSGFLACFWTLCLSSFSAFCFCLANGSFSISVFLRSALAPFPVFLLDLFLVCVFLFVSSWRFLSVVCSGHCKLGRLLTLC